MAKKHKPKGKKGGRNGGSKGGSANGSTKSNRKKGGQGKSSGAGRNSSDNRIPGRRKDDTDDVNPISGNHNHHHRHHHKMSMKREAWLTSEHREHSRGKLRLMPMVFIKSSEVYDPSKMEWDNVNKIMRQPEPSLLNMDMDIEIEQEVEIDAVLVDDSNLYLEASHPNETSQAEISKQIENESPRGNKIFAESSILITSDKDELSHSDDNIVAEGQGDDERSETASSGSVLQSSPRPGSFAPLSYETRLGSTKNTLQQSKVFNSTKLSHRANDLPVDVDHQEYSIGTAGTADDEDEDEAQSTSEEDDDEDMSNHSSDLEYEQLIGLRRLALRDLEVGDSIDDEYDELSQYADSSSNNDYGSDLYDTYDDDDDDDEEDDYIEDNDGDDESDYDPEDLREGVSGFPLDDSDTEPLPDGPVVKIISTQYGANGKEFVVQWSDEYALIRESNKIDEDEFYELYQDHGYTNEKIAKKIRSLGASMSDDEEAEDNRQELYFEDTQGMDAFASSGDELDAIIRQLVQEDNDVSARKKKNKDAILESFSESVLEAPKRVKKGKVPKFEVSDDEIREYLEKQWVKSREAKRIRKQQREELRKAGLLKKPKKSAKDVTHLKYRYLDKITVDDVVQEIENFIHNESTTTLQFPPVDYNARYIIEKLCQAYYLKSQCRGDGLNKVIIATKTSSSFGDFDEPKVNRYLNRRKVFPRTDTKRESVRRKRPAEMKLQKSSGGGGIVHHKEGDVVGATADELGADNIGRQMLEKMGWKVGMGLGTRSVGIIEPIAAKVKKTKWGIGMDI
ncbi:Sqs1p [Sugiyamaella lignohabitans]|uniref:Sqs1p n=1 Tax=Sugiyamaella lignohabitans TaxID=796027 RepID=A0A170QZA6_9ASCO|nr:Sqs1p [Sugiyamaella lignohabitans]ANB16006.1 Sqs1p [Sugiyamaella lignohabitans]